MWLNYSDWMTKRQCRLQPDAPSIYHMSHITRNVSPGTLDQARLKHIIPPKQRTTKVLIRVRGCAGWSAPLLFAYGINHILAWPGPYINLLRLLVYFYLLHICSTTSTYEPSHGKNLSRPYVCNKEADPPAHPHSLIDTFTIYCQSLTWSCNSTDRCSRDMAHILVSFISSSKHQEATIV